LAGHAAFGRHLVGRLLGVVVSAKTGGWFVGSMKCEYLLSYMSFAVNVFRSK
jgi:hypothetical protein